MSNEARIISTPTYRKFLTEAEADTVQKIRTVLSLLTSIDKTETVEQQKLTLEPTKIKYHQQSNWKSNSLNKFSLFHDPTASANRDSYQNRSKPGARVRHSSPQTFGYKVTTTEENEAG